MVQSVEEERFREDRVTELIRQARMLADACESIGLDGVRVRNVREAILQHERVAKVSPKRTSYGVMRTSDMKMSTGGTTPRFTALGKLFTSAGALTTHLQWFKDGPSRWTGDALDDAGSQREPGNRPRDMSDFVVVVYDILERKRVFAGEWLRGGR